jgi:hypothetical protein
VANTKCSANKSRTWLCGGKHWVGLKFRSSQVWVLVHSLHAYV